MRPVRVPHGLGLGAAACRARRARAEPPAGRPIVPGPASARERDVARGEEEQMPNSVYKVIEIVGSSPDSWEKAAQNAIQVASKSLRDLRVAEVGQLDMHIENGKVVAYRAKLKLSFKFEE